MNPTKLISRNIDIKLKDIEQIETQCCLCGNKNKEVIKAKKILSEKFTNYEYLKFKSDYMCTDCAKCIKDDRLRKNNFLADEDHIIFLKQNEIENYIFEVGKYIKIPFLFAITRSFKKHNSFKCNLNYDYDYFYIQEEDKKYLFDVKEMKKLYKILEDAYLFFTKEEMITGNYKFMSIEKYGKKKFLKLEEILNKHRGTHQFELLIYILNSEKRNEYIKRKKEEEKNGKKSKTMCSGNVNEHLELY